MTAPAARWRSPPKFGLIRSACSIIPDYGSMMTIWASAASKLILPSRCVVIDLGTRTFLGHGCCQSLHTTCFAFILGVSCHCQAGLFGMLKQNVDKDIKTSEKEWSFLRVCHQSMQKSRWLNRKKKFFSTGGTLSKCRKYLIRINLCCICFSSRFTFLVLHSTQRFRRKILVGKPWIFFEFGAARSTR